MTPVTDAPLSEQRQILRRQLLEQRKLIKHQLDHTQGVNSEYPRSMTMRFLTRRPALVAVLGTEFLTLFFSARFVKLMTVLLAVVRILQSSSANKQKKLPAPTITDSNIYNNVYNNADNNINPNL